MHTAILNQYYWPHGSATSQLITELAEGLAARGHRVTVATARVMGDDGQLAPAREQRRGVAIRRVAATRFGKGTLAGRLSDYGSFYVGGTAELMALRPGPDVVLALTTPPLIAAAAQLAGLARRFPTVALVQDVYPDIAVGLGLLRDGGLGHRAWRAAAGLSLRAAPRVIVLSEPMRRRVRSYGVPDARIATIPNWALAELDAPPSRRDVDAQRLRYGFGDRFVVMYSGNVGAGHTFDTLLDAAARLGDRPDVAFAVVGEGVRGGEVRARVAARQLDNVTLWPFAPRTALAASLGSADLHAITMRDGLEGMLMPSKLYGILAAARPALFIGPPKGAVAEVIRAAGCGDVVANGDVDGAVAAIVRRAADRAEARAAGERGRAWLRAHRGRHDAIDAYEGILREVAGRPVRAPAPVTPRSAAAPTSSEVHAR